MIIDNADILHHILVYACPSENGTSTHMHCAAIIKTRSFLSAHEHTISRREHICRTFFSEDEAADVYSDPRDCGDMVTSLCEQVVYVWGERAENV